MICYYSEQIQEAMLYCPDIKDIPLPSTQIEDTSILKEIAAKFGYKIRFVPNPNLEKPIEIVSDEKHVCNL